MLNGFKLSDTESNFISNIVFKELEHIKISASKDESVKYKARTLLRYLMTHQNMWMSPNMLVRTKIEKLL